MTTKPLTIIVVEKVGTLKTLTIKDYKEEDLYKKCGFKNANGFDKIAEWKVKKNSIKYFIKVFGKLEGRANNENKYDFPPPIDVKLLYGSCAIVAHTFDNTSNKAILANLTIPLWESLYEKLFGGFEDLTATALEDEEEEDELLNIPAHMKTKTGYLKDGFVVDTDDSSELTETSELSDVISEEDDKDNSDEEVEDVEDEDIAVKKRKPAPKKKKEAKKEIFDIDLGSELSEESYVL